MIGQSHSSEEPPLDNAPDAGGQEGNQGQAQPVDLENPIWYEMLGPRPLARVGMGQDWDNDQLSADPDQGTELFQAAGLPTCSSGCTGILGTPQADGCEPTKQSAEDGSGSLKKKRRTLLPPALPLELRRMPPAAVQEVVEHSKGVLSGTETLSSTTGPPSLTASSSKIQVDSLPAGVPLAPKEAAPCTLPDSLTEPHKALRQKLGLWEAPASEPVETEAELFLRDEFFRKVDVCNRWKQKAVEAMLFLDTAKYFGQQGGHRHSA